jgi:hypothetical protein
MLTSDPIAAGIRPGTSTTGSFDPPRPVASIRMIEAIRRREDQGDRSERGRRREDGRHRRRRALSHETGGEDAQAAARCNDRALRPEHAAQADRRKTGQQDPRQLDRPRRAGAEADPGTPPLGSGTRARGSTTRQAMPRPRSAPRARAARRTACSPCSASDLRATRRPRQLRPRLTPGGSAAAPTARRAPRVAGRTAAS